MEASIYTYPWDAADGGITENLERIKGLGINNISLMVSYHTGKLLLPHNPVRKVYYHRGGTVYFNPAAEKYGRLKPDKGDYFREYSAETGEDLLSDITDEAHKHGMGVRAWIVGCHNSRLGRLFPELTITNVFGEHYQHGLCPNQPEVRQYLLQMIEDLASGYRLDGMELESYDFMGFYHGAHHEINGLSDRILLEKTLGLCFCPACMRKAESMGIDAARLKAGIAEAANSVFEMRRDVVPENIEGYEKYIEMRVETIESLYREVRKKARTGEKSVPVYGICPVAGDIPPRFSGIDAKKVGKYVEGWVMIYPSGPSDVSSFVERALGKAAEGNRIIGGIRLIQPQLENVEQVAAYLEEYSKAGVYGVNFYNYGLAAKPVLEAVGAYRNFLI